MLHDKITEIFFVTDNFCNEFKNEYSKLSTPKLQGNKDTRNRAASMCDSEIITLLIAFHSGQFRNFKHFYTEYVCVHLKNDFPGLVSYNRFIELSHRHALVFMLFIQYARKGTCTGISFIDSTVLRVCHNKRIKRNKVFKGVAEVGKSTMGWFFGFKLHLIINDKGEILSFYLTKGNTDDRDVKTITEMTMEIFGKLFGDKGYISKALSDLLFGNLKNICQVEHTRHRSISGFLLNIMGAIAAYSFFPKKPSIKNDVKETNPKLLTQFLSQLQLAA